MKILLLLLLLVSTHLLAGTKLLLIGGGKRPLEAMKEFVTYSGNDKAEILVFPWASETSEGADNIKLELSALSVGAVEVIPHKLSNLEVEKLSQKIKTCSGIFFAGGDQNKLMT